MSVSSNAALSRFQFLPDDLVVRPGSRRPEVFPPGIIQNSGQLSVEFGYLVASKEIFRPRQPQDLKAVGKPDDFQAVSPDRPWT